MKKILGSHQSKHDRCETVTDFVLSRDVEVTAPTTTDVALAQTSMVPREFRQSHGVLMKTQLENDTLENYYKNYGGLKVRSQS